ncbi:MAG: CRISPR-associated protein Csh1 [Clostridia bacterium]|nr:CRISPR-associated protein Csh1 [Clostridia bacterium]
MGFISAIRSLGSLAPGKGLDPYLIFPMEKGGRLIRVALKVADREAEQLEVLGVAWVDLADQIMQPEMKGKYLYRKRAGSAAAWGFSPIHLMGKPKKDSNKNREAIFGKGDNWAQDKDCHLNKIRNKLLLDYEREETFSPGSVDRVMAELPEKLKGILPQLDPKSSHAFIFGLEGDDGSFLYPGEVPAFFGYFRRKLEDTLKLGEEQVRCAYCRKLCTPRSLSKIFKFSTGDKVSTYHGLDKEQEVGVFPICSDCFEGISSGRDRLQMKLNNNTVLPGINIWTLPEAVGGGGGRTLKQLIASVEEGLSQDRLQSPGEKRESRYFSRLAQEGSGLVFHFIFWERNNAQELVHLMVEDVPPERLAMLERKWGEAIKAVFGDVGRDDLFTLDWAIKSLYKTLSGFAGKSEGDKKVFRDYALKVIGKMLRGERLPVAFFKQAVVERAARLAFESGSWNDVARTLLYAQAWADYMYRINQEVAV